MRLGTVVDISESTPFQAVRPSADGAVSSHFAEGNTSFMWRHYGCITPKVFENLNAGE